MKKRLLALTFILSSYLSAEVKKEPLPDLEAKTPTVVVDKRENYFLTSTDYKQW